ncbi:MAG: hypothetical protein IJG50_04425 [Clostridia bacterium]|nr:hypothetical protein [Clostridia bacterium]
MTTIGKHVSSEKKKGKDRRDILLIVFAVIAILAILVAVWAIMTRNKDAPTSQAIEAPAALTETQEHLTDQIALPQMAWINLDADKTEQAKTFTNPAENFAQFRVTIFMDGEVLWQSTFLKPGETSAPMVLVHTLSPGEYDANLIYECVTNDAAKTPLNGANSPIKLKVY